MNHNQIKGALMLATGKRPADIATENKIAISTIYRVIKGELKTQYVREFIADTIGKPVDEVFPPLPDQNKAAA